MTDLRELLRERILILDGAMGTMIQQYHLNEADYRGDFCEDISSVMKGNNDMLVLTRPDVITDIHRKYLKAGADIIETNTFNATSISQEEYHTSHLVSQINTQAAILARTVADEYTHRNPKKPRFVAGSVGPTNKTTSMSPDVNDPAYRAVTFDTMQSAYFEQMVALIKGGVDMLLIETIFDTLNTKAAMCAAEKAMAETNRQVPIMLSLTLSDKGGRTLSGQTIEAFLISVSHIPVLSIGLNCSFGAHDMKPFLKELGEISPFYVSAYPNAGLPNRFGEYDETPEKMASQIEEFFNDRLVNIIGGCCGTTPEHISAFAELAKTAQPHIPASIHQCTDLSGLEPLHIISDNNFVNVGERCNVAGSRKFLRLIKEKKYDEAIQIARQQVEDGAQIIDINMDDNMLDAQQEMIHFLNLIAAEPEICRIPMMIDSSKFDVLEAGLKCVQGKSVINSISLKEGEKKFLERAHIIHSLGAAVIVMAFDEQGQADSFERRISICQRAYRLLVDKIHFNPYDIIFDPNVLAIATGIKEHNNYCVDFIKATAWIKMNLPGAKVSGGVSNLSFSFRGNNQIREMMHAVFLYHAIQAGMDMGIVNPATTITYADIPADLLTIVEDVVLNRRPDATDRLIEVAEKLKEEAETKNIETTDTQINAQEKMDVGQRLRLALRKGIADNLADDIEEALKKYPKAIDIIDGPLMDGMNEVGQLFGAGKMFLPQVVKTARTMKRAVELLQPVIEQQKNGSKASTCAGRFLVATVKGDVHDIGKNIVSVILSCNNFEVIDLGVMVDKSDIIRTAIEKKVDFIGLSGLITPSLQEMCHVAQAMEEAGLSIPLMIGGATTSALHTAVKIAPNYCGPVFHVKDAAQNPVLASQLMQPESKKQLISQLKEEQQYLRDSLLQKKSYVSIKEANRIKLRVDWEKYNAFAPNNPGIHELDHISIEEIRPYINWTYFFHAWKISGDYAQIAHIKGCDTCRASWLASFSEKDRQKAAEAMQLYKEANRLLDRLQMDLQCGLKARFGLFKAFSTDNVICIEHDNRLFKIPVLRQQMKNNEEKEGQYLSLADYIAPNNSNKIDYAGSFVVSIGNDIANLIRKFKEDGDDYQTLLLQSLSDRLVEAASEWLHEKVRTKYWGYAYSEKLSDSDLKKMRFEGIRPAVGYPSLPDQSLNFILDELLHFQKIGVTLTEHGAMYPNATVSGLYIANPQSRYFRVGNIGEDQLDYYASQRNMDIETVKKFLAGNLI